MHAKLCATSLHDVLHDLNVVLKSGRLASAIDRAEVGLVASALRVGGSHIGTNPNSLAFDLLGQLLVYYDKHPPVSCSSTSTSVSSSTGDESPSCECTMSSSSSPEIFVDRSAAVAQDEGAKLSKPDSSHLRVHSPSFGDAAAAGNADDVVLNDRSGTFFDDIPDGRLAHTARHDRVMHGLSAESGIRSLLQQCDLRSPIHSALLPILPCFDSPTAETVCILEGHSAVTSDLAFLPPPGNQSQSTANAVEDVELVSIAADGTVCNTGFIIDFYT